MKYLKYQQLLIILLLLIDSDNKRILPNELLLRSTMKEVGKDINFILNEE